ncbi:MAG: hypothetical protein HKP08_03390 [Flavobacteriaceae bacterium]|nr:hypothetical protein [Flavobacteriaceae bacterium]
MIFDFYVKASIHVSLAVVSFLYLTSCFLNIYIPKNLFFYVFFSTIPAYNFIKQSQKGENQFLRLLLVDKKILWLSFVSLGCAAYFGLQLAANTLIGVSILALLVVFYTIPLFPSRKNLRHFGIVKILIIGLVWTGATVILPVLEVRENLVWDVWIESWQRFLVILVLMVPFEIRDLGVDSNEMMTIPQRLGIYKTRRAGILLSLIFFLLTFLMDDLSKSEAFGKALVAISLVTLMIRLPKKQSRYFASFWVEALPIFWAGLLYVTFEIV